MAALFNYNPAGRLLKHRVGLVSFWN